MTSTNNKPQAFSSISKDLATLTHNMKQHKRIRRTVGANDLKTILPASHKVYSILTRGKDNFRTESGWKILN